MNLNEVLKPKTEKEIISLIDKSKKYSSKYYKEMDYFRDIISPTPKHFIFFITLDKLKEYSFISYETRKILLNEIQNIYVVELVGIKKFKELKIGIRDNKLYPKDQHFIVDEIWPLLKEKYEEIIEFYIQIVLNEIDK